MAAKTMAKKTTVIELRAQLASLGLPITGKKHQLLQRLEGKRVDGNSDKDDGHTNTRDSATGGPSHTRKKDGEDNGTHTMLSEREENSQPLLLQDGKNKDDHGASEYTNLRNYSKTSEESDQYDEDDDTHMTYKEKAHGEYPTPTRRGERDGYTSRRLSLYSETDDSSDDDEVHFEVKQKSRTPDSNLGKIALRNKTCKNSSPKSNRCNNNRGEWGNVRRHHHHGFNFRDVEDALETFDGKPENSVVRWIENFEEMADVLEWNDLQMLVYGRKLMKGVARTFLMSQDRIMTWARMKKALRLEFYSPKSSAEIHDRLRTYKKTADQDLMDYVYEMIKIAAEGRVEETATIQYICDGLLLDERTKLIMYEAETLKEFKKKLSTYSKLMERRKGDVHQQHRNRDDLRQPNRREDARRMISEMRPTVVVKCFNCGASGHRSQECRRKTEGPKCFKCGRFGHKSDACTTRQTPVLMVTSNSSSKVVKIGDVSLSAIIDTGSDVNILSDDVFHE